MLIAPQSKIQRIVFETMSKWDGWMEVPLEASQVKQIAGRAGRFGMGAEGGIVTTFESSDLPLLKAAMDTQPESLRHARVGFFSHTLRDLLAALPRDSTATTARDALLFCSVLPPSMAVMDPTEKDAETMRYIDAFSQDLASAERALLLQCPFPAMDDRCKAVLSDMFRRYRDRLSVDLRAVLLDSGLLEALEQVLAAKQANRALEKPRQDLGSLETLHSVLTLYAWLSLRSGIAFHAYDLAVALRKATEDAMEHCLRFSTSSSRGHPERSFGFTGGKSRTYVMNGPFVTKASLQLL
jgi:ATP-dependent RNA helicase SUPV3L1/SUV3